MTHPPNAPRWRTGRWTGPASDSPGPRWPGRPRPSTGTADRDLAAVLRRLHASPAERAALADRALDRARERFAWSAVARATADQYRDVMEPACRTFDSWEENS